MIVICFLQTGTYAACSTKSANIHRNAKVLDPDSLQIYLDASCNGEYYCIEEMWTNTDLTNCPWSSAFCVVYDDNFGSTKVKLSDIVSHIGPAYYHGLSYSN